MTNNQSELKKAKDNDNQIKLLCQLHKTWRNRSYITTHKDVEEIVKKYQKTEKGIITLRYSWLKREAEKKEVNIPGKKDFKDWSLNDYDFQDLYSSYSASGFKSKFSPVVRRIDTNKGFTLDNLIWEVNMKASGAVKIENEQGQVETYPSAREAERKLNFPQGVISRALRTSYKYKKLKISFA